MSDSMKLIVMGVGGVVVSFLLMLGLFAIVLSPGDEAASEQAMEAQQGGMAGGQGMAATTEMARQRMQQRVPGGEVLAFADVLGEEIPLETSVDGYGWAKWGMSPQDVKTRLASEGVRDTVSFSPPDNPEFISLVSLNPDSMRYKVEYRFYENKLFHIEVYYSDYFQNNSFSAFLLSKMSEYGRPYDLNVRVDELGNVNLYAKWDTEDSMIELLSKPEGKYALFLDYQLVLYQLEEKRRNEERLTF